MHYQDVDMDISLNIGKLENKKPAYELIKRILDFLLCLIASSVALPLTAIACLCVLIESEGNPIYVQDRLGKDGKLFKLYKIRSMCIDAEKQSGPKWADKNDSRITKTGAFIRRTRIDELPQLLNIIKGEMSIVGPRPERPIFTYIFESETPGFAKRLQVKPGLTGIAQVNGGYDITYKEKLLYDLQYIEKRSLWLDIKIIIKTVWIVFSGQGAH